jgi:hypothetical protein
MEDSEFQNIILLSGSIAHIVMEIVLSLGAAGATEAMSGLATFALGAASLGIGLLVGAGINAGFHQLRFEDHKKEFLTKFDEAKLDEKLLSLVEEYIEDFQKVNNTFISKMYEEKRGLFVDPPLDSNQPEGTPSKN